MKIQNLTENYLHRPVDSRMVAVIESTFRETGSVIDVACGSGIYGVHLRKRFAKVYGIDFDPKLCERARAGNGYTEIFCDRVENIADHIGECTSIFCSEFFEHLTNEGLPPVARTLERIASSEIVITVPNPLSPHFKHDPTHVLKYNIFSLLKTLNQSTTYRYSLRPLGFSEFNLSKVHYRALNPLSRRIALLSPTVLYVGRRIDGS